MFTPKLVLHFEVALFCMPRPGEVLPHTLVVYAWQELILLRKIALKAYYRCISIAQNIEFLDVPFNYWAPRLCIVMQAYYIQWCTSITALQNRISCSVMYRQTVLQISYGLYNAIISIILYSAAGLFRVPSWTYDNLFTRISSSWIYARILCSERDRKSQLTSFHNLQSQHQAAHISITNSSQHEPLHFAAPKRSKPKWRHCRRSATAQ